MWRRMVAVHVIPLCHKIWVQLLLRHGIAHLWKLCCQKMFKIAGMRGKI